MTAPERPGPRRRRRWPIVLAVVMVALIGAVAWFALSARTAYADLTASRDALLAARNQISDTELPAAKASLTTAADHASSAADAVSGPLWDLAAAVPVVGDTPRAVQAVATSLDQALSALAPAAESLGALDPNTLVGDDGRIDLEALKDAVPTMQAARTGLTGAVSTLAEAPSTANGDRVIAQVDDAARQLATELTDLDGTLGTAITAGTIAPPLLGVDGPKRYLVAILNPNEARGTGGFLGQYVILRADSGRITVEQVGSNSDLPSLPSTPPELGAQFIARYEPGPRLMPNLNISPHHPAAGLLWRESWRLKTGEELDGAFSADVVALGELVTATGQEVQLPDGGSLTGSELTEFALSGIYAKFPSVADVGARKAYQEAVTASAFDVVTGSANRAALASALGAALSERRIQLWSTDDTTQAAILEADVGGTLAVPDGHQVTFVALNSSASKLDAFLERDLAYEVGRCPLPDTDRVLSRVTVELTNAIPEGATVPEYMISGAERGPDGPVNSMLAEVYLPLGAEVVEVMVDGESSEYRPFLEQDRPAVLLELDLPPRQARTVTVEFTEPAHDGPAVVTEQPLGAPQETSITDLDCAALPAAMDDDGEEN